MHGHEIREHARALFQQIDVGALRVGTAQRFHQGIDAATQLIPRRAEGLRALLVAPADEARVLHGPVHEVAGLGPRRAVRGGGIAHGHDEVEGLLEKLLGGLRARVVHADAELLDRVDRQRMDESRGTRAGRNRIQQIAVVEAGERFGHLAARRVASAEKKNPTTIRRHGLSISHSRASSDPLLLNWIRNSMIPAAPALLLGILGLSPADPK